MQIDDAKPFTAVRVHLAPWSGALGVPRIIGPVWAVPPACRGSAGCQDRQATQASTVAAQSTRSMRGFFPGRRHGGRCGLDQAFEHRAIRRVESVVRDKDFCSASDRDLSSVQSCIAVISVSREMKSICRATMPRERVPVRRRAVHGSALLIRESFRKCESTRRGRRGIIAMIIRQPFSIWHDFRQTTPNRRNQEVGYLIQSRRIVKRTSQNRRMRPRIMATTRKDRRYRLDRPGRDG